MHLLLYNLRLRTVGEQLDGLYCKEIVEKNDVLCWRWLRAVTSVGGEPRESAFVNTATTLNDPTHIVAMAMGRSPVNA